MIKNDRWSNVRDRSWAPNDHFVILCRMFKWLQKNGYGLAIVPYRLNIQHRIVKWMFVIKRSQSIAGWSIGDHLITSIHVMILCQTCKRLRKKSTRDRSSIVTQWTFKRLLINRMRSFSVPVWTFDTRSSNELS